MFFYAALFIASLIVAAVSIWLYRSITGAGRKVYKSILPSSKSKSALERHLDHVALRNRGRGTASPWGSGDRTRPGQHARVVSQSRSAANYRAEGDGKRESRGGANYGRPRSGLALGSQHTWACRDEEFEFAGKPYTVKRQASTK